MNTSTVAHKPSSGDFFEPLDGLRGFAILSVVIYHTAYFNPAHPFQKFLFLLVQAGGLGVPIFFVLSGFLISYTVFKAGDDFAAGPYAARRAAKILPPLMLFIPYAGLIEQNWSGVGGFLHSFFGNLATLPHFEVAFPMPVAPWSLYIEMHFYLVFPLLYFAFRKVMPKWADWAVFLAFLIIPAALRLPRELPLDTSDWAYHTHFFPKALDYFSFGILFSVIALRYRHSPALPRWSAVLAPLGAVLLLAAYATCVWLLSKERAIWEAPQPGTILGAEFIRYLTTLATALLLFVIFLPRPHPLVRLLSFRPLCFLGLVSYEWFLLHFTPVEWLSTHLGDASGKIGLYLARTALPFFGTLALSALVYFYFSAPILSWTKRWLARRDERAKHPA